MLSAFKISLLLNVVVPIHKGVYFYLVCQMWLNKNIFHPQFKYFPILIHVLIQNYRNMTFDFNFLMVCSQMVKSSLVILLGWLHQNNPSFLFIFTFTHHHVAHSFILLIALFHFIPHVLVFCKCWKGTNRMSSFRYFKGFFAISHILSSINHKFQGVWCDIWCQFFSSHYRIRISQL